MDRTDHEQRVEVIYAALGRKRPSLAWAKAELFLGLASIAMGLELAANDIVARVVCGALVALGGYLALAGHRTHLYDAMTRQAAVHASLDRDATRAPT